MSKIGKRLIIFIGTLILLLGSLLSPCFVLAEVYAQDSNPSVVNSSSSVTNQDVSNTSTTSPPTTQVDSNASQSNVTSSTASSSTSNSTVTSQNENNNVTSSENATATSKTTDNVTPSDNKAQDSSATETQVSNASSQPKKSLAAPKVHSKVATSGPSTSDISTPLDIDVTKVSFYLEFDPDGEGSSVYTGKLFRIYQRLEFDNDKVTDGVYSIIKIAKKYVKAGSVEIPKLDSVKNVESMDDDEYYIRKVYYNPVAGGGIIAFPIIFKHVMYTTPPGSATPVSSTLYLREHKIGYSELKATAKTHNPYISKYVVNKGSNQMWYDVGQDVGMPDVNDPTYSSNNLDELLTCYYLITVTNGGMFDDYGVYYRAVGTIKDVLPEGMVFDKDDPEAAPWTYDEATRTVSFPDVGKYMEEHGTRRLQLRLPVKLRHVKLGQKIINSVSLLDEQGNEIGNHSVGFTPYAKQTKYGSGSVDKKLIAGGGELDESNNEMEWKVAPKFEERMAAQKYYINGLGDLINNNGPRIYKGTGDSIQTAGEKTLELKEVTVHIPEGVDVGTIKLYGKTLRETQFRLLKDNVQSDQAISLTSDIEYVKATFEKPILARTDVYLTVKTKVVDEKWPKGIFSSDESTSSTTLHNWGFVYYSDDQGKVIGEKYKEAVGSYNRAFLTLRVEYDDNWQTSIEAHNEDKTRLTYILTPNRVDENMPFTIVTLLPDGIDVINEYHRSLENMGYKVVHHYLGTDKTALIITKTLKEIDSGENYPIQKYRYAFRQQIQFNKYLTKAVHQLDHYIYWYDPSVLKTTSGWADESTIVNNNQLDLDGKGTFVGKSVLKAMTKVDFGPPEEVIIHEKIGHTPEDLSVHPLIVSPLEEFYYEINLENRTKQTSKPYAFYNILPHKGDTMNDQDRIIDRGSTDGAIFKKIAKSDPDFDVYYSEVQDIQKLTTANWQPLTDSVDASKVKSIKVVLKKEMQANTVKKLLIQMRASHNPADLLSHNSSLLTQEGKTFLLDSNVVEARGVGELTKPVLQVLKEVDKTTAFSKDVLQYTFNVKNTGDGTWYGTLEDVLPEKDVNYIANSTKVNTKAITDKLWENATDLAVSDENVWNDNSLRYLVTIKPGQELKLSFKTKIVKAEDGIIVNRFYGVNAENPDFNKDSNTVETQIYVRKLVVNKAVDKAKAKTGDTLTYQLTVENTGTARWVGMLTDKLTDDLQAVKTDAGSFEGNTLSVPIDLEQGQTQTITFTAKVLRKKAGEILNHASVIHENIPELNVESNEVKTVVEEEPEPTPTEPEEKPDEPEPTPTEPEDKPDEPDPTPTEPEDKPDEPEPTPTEPEEKPDEPDPPPTEPEDKPDEPDPTPTEPEDKPDEPDPTPTEPEDKPDELEPTPTEPEDKPDEPGVPNTAERENDDRYFMNSGGKLDNQKRSTQGTVKQKELTRVAKSNTKKHLPATGTQKNGYLWLSVISLGLAGIVIYFDRRSRWHR